MKGNQKIIALIFIALLTFIFVFAINFFKIPTGNFLGDLKNFILPVQEGKVNFSLSIDNKADDVDILLSPRKPVDIFIKSTKPFLLEIEASGINMSYTEISITGFEGVINLSKISSLNGKFDSIHSAGLDIAPKEPYEIKISNIDFDLFDIKNIQVNKLNLNKSDGLLILQNMDIQINNEAIEILGFQGNLTASESIELSGACYQMKIGERVAVS